jgi:hypothetical protein
MNRKVALFAAPLLGATASLLTTMSASHAQGGGTVIATDIPVTPGDGTRQEVFSSDGPCESAEAQIPNSYYKTTLTNVSDHPITGQVMWSDMSTAQPFLIQSYSNMTLVDAGRLDSGGRLSFTSCPTATPVPTGPTATPVPTGPTVTPVPTGPTPTIGPTGTETPSGSPTPSLTVIGIGVGAVPAPAITS